MSFLMPLFMKTSRGWSSLFNSVVKMCMPIFCVSHSIHTQAHSTVYKFPGICWNEKWTYLKSIHLQVKIRWINNAFCENSRDLIYIRFSLREFRWVTCIDTWRYRILTEFSTHTNETLWILPPGSTSHDNIFIGILINLALPPCHKSSNEGISRTPGM